MIVNYLLLNLHTYRSLLTSSLTPLSKSVVTIVPTLVPSGSFSDTVKVMGVVGNTGGLSLTSVSSITTCAVPLNEEPCSAAVTVKVILGLKKLLIKLKNNNSNNKKVIPDTTMAYCVSKSSGNCMLVLIISPESGSARNWMEPDET